MPGIADRRNRATKTSHQRRLLWNDFATRRNLPGDVGANARGPLGPTDDHYHTDWKREVSMRKTRRVFASAAVSTDCGDSIAFHDAGRTTRGLAPVPSLRFTFVHRIASIG